MRLTPEQLRNLLVTNPDLALRDNQGVLTPRKAKKGISTPRARRSPLERRTAVLLRHLDAPPWVEEARIVPGRRFRADFYWPEAKVVLEIQGGIYAPKSGHRSVGGLERDWTKNNLAQLNGLVYFQLGSRQITFEWLKLIIAFIKGRITT